MNADSLELRAQEALGALLHDPDDEVAEEAASDLAQLSLFVLNEARARGIGVGLERCPRCGVEDEYPSVVRRQGRSVFCRACHRSYLS